MTPIQRRTFTLLYYWHRSSLGHLIDKMGGPIPDDVKNDPRWPGNTVGAGWLEVRNGLWDELKPLIEGGADGDDKKTAGKQATAAVGIRHPAASGKEKQGKAHRPAAKSAKGRG